MNTQGITAIVQARAGSTRLPGKSLMSLHGVPLIDWISMRLKKSEKLTDIVFAIPDTPKDDDLAEHLLKNNCKIYRGSENDVLARMLGAARQTNSDYMVRVCADNPLIWWKAIDRLIDFYFHIQPDYAYNHIPRHNLWPDGLGAEIVSVPLLEKLDYLAKTPAQREHCLNYIWDNPDQFQIATFNPHEEWLQRTDLKLDIDTLQDYQKLNSWKLDPSIDGLEMINACSNS